MYAERRKKLLDRIGEGTIIVAGARQRIRTPLQPYSFRQNSDFFYLTGFPEPDAIAVLRRKKGKDDFTLFVRPRDPKMESWNGRREGPEGAIRNYSADRAYSIDSLFDVLPKYLDVDRILVPRGKKNPLVSKADFLIDRDLEDIYGHLHKMRLIKSPDEIGLMKTAIGISVKGHLAAMRGVRPNMKEYELQALIEHEFVKNGGRDTAYPSIVGGGKNALCLQYIANDDVLDDGDLVVLDAGAEYNMYASDLTTTFPVNGRFTEPQRILYDIALKVQRRCIASVAPGKIFSDITKIAQKTATDELCSSGVIDMAPEDFMRISKGYQRHSCGHYIGMDVLDVGDRKKGYEPGAVITIEPGLYIPVDDELFPEEFHGIGIRIEDDVLVTEDGCEVLSECVGDMVPRTPDEIEEFMRH